jgi:hypothetical protein
MGYAWDTQFFITMRKYIRVYISNLNMSNTRQEDSKKLEIFLKSVLRDIMKLLIPDQIAESSYSIDYGMLKDPE